MPLVFQQFISRRDLRENPGTIFVFGDNEQRIGMGGQAGACRGEPNALGVATKARPSMSESSMWSDADFDRCAAIVDKDLKPAFDHIRKGGTVVFPESGIGTGLSQLPQRAPRLMEHIRNRVRELKALSNEVAADNHLTPQRARRFG